MNIKISKISEFMEYSKLYENIPYSNYEKYVKMLNLNILLKNINDGHKVDIDIKLYNFIKNFWKFLNFKNFISMVVLSDMFKMLKYNKNMLIITAYYNNIHIINHNGNEIPFDAIVSNSGHISKEEEDKNTLEATELEHIKNFWGTFSANRDFYSSIIKSTENKYDNIIVQTATYQYERLASIYYAIIAPDMYYDLLMALNSLRNGGTIFLILRLSVVLPSIKKIMYLMGELFENTNIIESNVKRTIIVEFVNFKRQIYEKRKDNLFKLLEQINKYSIDIKKYQTLTFPPNSFYKSDVEHIDYDVLYDFNLEVEKNSNGTHLIDSIKIAYIDFISDINKTITMYYPFDNIRNLLETRIYKILQELINEMQKNNIAYNKYYLSSLKDFKVNIVEYFFSMEENINFHLIDYGNLADIQEKSEKYCYELFNNIDAKMMAVKKAHTEIINTYNSDITKQIIRVVEDFTRGINHYLKMPYPISNAFVKLWEIYATFNLFKGKTDIKTFHFCEAPGQFIKCTQYYISKKIKNANHTWKANSLNPFNKTVVDKFGANLFKDHYGLMKNNMDSWVWGADNTGDVTKTANIKWYRELFMKNPLDLVTGDGGLAVQDNELVVLQKLDYAQFLMTVAVSSRGGSCVIKTFTPFLSTIKESKYASGFFVGLIYLYCHFFETVNLFKPYSSNLASGEFYVIGKKFKGIDETTLNKLYGILDNFKENQTFFNKKEIPDEFTNQIFKFVEKLTELNLHSFEKLNFFMICKLDNNEDFRKETKCMDFLDTKFLDNFLKKRYDMWIEKFDFE